MVKRIARGVALTYAGSVDDLSLVYTVHGWHVTFGSDPGSPMYGPERLTIIPPHHEDIDSAVESDGITVEVIRSLPIGDARRRLADLKTAQRRGSGGRIKVPARVESDEAWARFAALYVDLVNAGYRHPISELQRRTGIKSRNTVSARLRRARHELGYLDGPDGKPADRLTPKALQILKDLED